MRRRASFGRSLVLIAAAALALRVLYTLIAAPDLVGFHDHRSYHAIARLIADGRGFIDPFELAEHGKVVPTAYHPPLWPWLLAAIAKLGFGSVLAQKLAGCVVGACVVAVTGLIGRRVAGDLTGLLAAGLMALYPLAWIADASLMTESLSALTMGVLMLAALRFQRAPGPGAAALVGALSGVATLARGEAIFLLAILVLPLCLRTSRQRLLFDWHRLRGPRRRNRALGASQQPDLPRAVARDHLGGLSASGRELPRHLRTTTHRKLGSLLLA